MAHKDENQTEALPQEAALAELRELVVRAKRGDSSVLPRLREFFQQAPQLWTQCGDLALQSQAAWIKLIAGKDKHLQECLAHKVNALKMSLANEQTPTLENLLVERVVCTWLQLYYHELLDAQQPEKSLKWAEFRLKQLTVASERHVKSIGALATLKKLLPATSPAELPAPAIAAEPERRAARVGRSAAAPAADALVGGRKVNARKNGHVHNRVAALLCEN